MWRKWIAGGMIATLALVFVSNVAMADTPPTNLTMQGQATIINGTQTSQLRLKASDTGSTGWLIEVSLNPTMITADSKGNPIINLSGPFTLGIPQHPIANGIATGWVNNNGNGDIKLTDAKTATSLDMSFVVASSGMVTAQTNGVWPALPTAQPATIPSTPVQPINHVFWYISRTTAIAAYILLFINVCLGLMLKSTLTERTMGRWRALDLHQFTALTAMALLGAHVFSLLGDKFSNFNLIQVLVPFASPYRLAWTAMGVIGFYLAIVVTFSAYIRKHIGYKTWRVIHLSAVLLFVLSLLHSIMAGTDSSSLWMEWIYVITGTIAAYLFFWRFMEHRSPESSTNGKTSAILKQSST